ncbi:MAG TPA: flagellar assembly protein FliH [Eoetvoesiella sp.]|uniref:flagellar assembly protein FliH n=1 Tax=Eoetvoesiella sp. TaxID=1966355 RepID=UPI002BBCD5D0|nr:flagellar assembly protein FliH [Eoetvoesiella sp.]HWK59890.1 flagellar assembly protein FliH [Eoetvoesiella sp.]
MSDRHAYDPQPYAGTGWRRWEMSDFEAQRAREAEAARKNTLPDDVITQLEQLGREIRAKAQEEGHKAGYAAGHKEGLAAGKAAGDAMGREEGRKAGFQAGHEEGWDLARKEAEQLNTLARSCAESILSMENEVGQALINLAINIAGQVIRSTLDAHPEKILDTVRDILHMESNSESLLRLRVHPDDLQLVREHLAEDPIAGKWRLVADETLARGGCIAETALGNIDATLQTRWQRITSTLGLPRAWDSQP